MRVVGIAGGTASGKTTLARALMRAFGERASLLTHDRYYHSMPTRFRARPSEYNFDHPDALDTAAMVSHLEELRAGHAARVPRYDYARHERLPLAHWDTVEPREVLVVEGILVFGDPRLRACFDHKVYVDAPADVRLARRIRRDVAERGRDVEGVLTQYEATVRPMHERFVEPTRAVADLVVDGTRKVESLVQRVLSVLGR